MSAQQTLSTRGSLQLSRLAVLLTGLGWLLSAVAQTPPSDFELTSYTGLFRAVVLQDDEALAQALESES